MSFGDCHLIGGIEIFEDPNLPSGFVTRSDVEGVTWAHPDFIERMHQGQLDRQRIEAVRSQHNQVGVIRTLLRKVGIK